MGTVKAEHHNFKKNERKCVSFYSTFAKCYLTLMQVYAKKISRHLFIRFIFIEKQFYRFKVPHFRVLEVPHKYSNAFLCGILFTKILFCMFGLSAHNLRL